MTPGLNPRVDLGCEHPHRASCRHIRLSTIGRFPYTGMTGGPARIIASANGCTGLPPNPWSLGGLGQSSQMSLASVIVANPCRVRSGLAVPLIVIILLSW